MEVNAVKAIRLKQGLTQAALAKKTGTTQQQIQRIEAGQAARIDIAVRISGALGVALERAFPKARSALRRLKSTEDAGSPKNIEKLEVAFREGGIDSDPAQWFLKLQLLSGVRKVYAIDGGEKARLWSVLQGGGGDDSPFIVFDGLEAQVAVRRDQIAYVHFLFEPPSMVAEDDVSGGVEVFFSNSSEPLLLEVDPDPDVDDDREEDDGQLRGALYQLDLDPEPGHVVVLTDIDDETVFIRAGALALLEVPQRLVLPDDGSDEEGEDDSDEDVDGAEEEPAGAPEA